MTGNSDFDVETTSNSSITQNTQTMTTGLTTEGMITTGVTTTEETANNTFVEGDQDTDLQMVSTNFYYGKPSISHSQNVRTDNRVERKVISQPIITKTLVT